MNSSKNRHVGAASHSHEDNPLVVEARMQSKALGTLSVYRRIAYSGIAIGVWLIYLSIYGSLASENTSSIALIVGIVLLVISTPFAGILYVGINHGKKNVEKIIKVLEQERDQAQKAYYSNSDDHDIRTDHSSNDNPDDK